MSVIPFALVGALYGHWLMKTLGFVSGLSMMSVFGFLAASGVVVNSSLVLVHHINGRLAEGATVAEAADDVQVAGALVGPLVDRHVGDQLGRERERLVTERVVDDPREGLALRVDVDHVDRRAPVRVALAVRVDVRPADLEQDTRPMARRYFGEKLGDLYVEQSGAGGEVFTMRPERWRTVDYAKLAGSS